jgi:RimJ/RimL family protein N-acetyltransferase
MMDIIELTTPRLILRQWQTQDRSIFARMNADPDVMRYYPALLSTQESNALADRIENLIAIQGWGFWALEELTGGRFIGFTGLHHPDESLPCAPCVEIGWRLAKDYWGYGYATEAATVALSVAFEQLDCEEVYSFTALPNLKSQAVMQRLGMQDTGRNFKHPEVPEGHPLREHVLYCLSKEAWKGNTKQQSTGACR